MELFGKVNVIDASDVLVKNSKGQELNEAERELLARMVEEKLVRLRGSSAPEAQRVADIFNRTLVKLRGGPIVRK